ncbi:MAG: diaminopimelate decarboxylase [Gammaproteobacteria bacterium]|nr:diaminopimelate decarboxylase [Gammaproteobacteria bacterium]
MDYFSYRKNQLYAEETPLADLARRFGTPTYIYSRAALQSAWHGFDNALSKTDHLICYSVKANSNLGVLDVLARLGSGFDIVSAGELERVIAAGGDPHKVVFSGVGKRSDEIRRALQAGIHCFNVESEAELQRINDVADSEHCRAPVSLRVNPDVDAKTHPYISTGLKENKFGIAIEDAEGAYQLAASLSHLNIIGIDCHIGSQLTEITPFIDALQRVLQLLDRLTARGITISHVNLGGGLGIRYNNETPPAPDEYINALLPLLAGRRLKLLLEPGRAIVGNAGVLLTKVEFLKHSAHKNFAIIDAAMNDLMRPALYQAYHDIVAVAPRQGDTPKLYDIVGPVCETGDFLGKDRQLALLPGDLLAVYSAGAYGSCMSSNYNTRPRAAEVMVDGSHAYLVREREKIEQLFAGEHRLLV